MQHGVEGIIPRELRGSLCWVPIFLRSPQPFAREAAGACGGNVSCNINANFDCLLIFSDGSLPPIPFPHLPLFRLSLPCASQDSYDYYYPGHTANETSQYLWQYCFFVVLPIVLNITQNT